MRRGALAESKLVRPSPPHTQRTYTQTQIHTHTHTRTHTRRRSYEPDTVDINADEEDYMWLLKVLQDQIPTVMVRGHTARVGGDGGWAASGQGAVAVLGITTPPAHIP